MINYYILIAAIVGLVSSSILYIRDCKDGLGAFLLWIIIASTAFVVVNEWLSIYCEEDQNNIEQIVIYSSDDAGQND